MSSAGQYLSDGLKFTKITTFGAALARLRAESAISYHDLGNMVGAKKKDIQAWEANTEQPSNQQLQKLYCSMPRLKHFGVNLLKADDVPDETAEKIMREIGETARAARLEEKLSLEELATLTGLKVEELDAFEHDGKLPMGAAGEVTDFLNKVSQALPSITSHGRAVLASNGFYNKPLERLSLEVVGANGTVSKTYTATTQKSLAHAMDRADKQADKINESDPGLAGEAYGRAMAKKAHDAKVVKNATRNVQDFAVHFGTETTRVANNIEEHIVGLADSEIAEAAALARLMRASAGTDAARPAETQLAALEAGKRKRVRQLRREMLEPLRKIAERLNSIVNSLDKDAGPQEEPTP